jgi:transposase
VLVTLRADDFIVFVCSIESDRSLAGGLLHERAQVVQWFQHYVSDFRQVLALDAKKYNAFTCAKRLFRRSYCAIGERLPLGTRVSDDQKRYLLSTKPVEVLGVIGWVPTLPTATGDYGDIGMITYMRSEKKCSKKDLQEFLLFEVPKIIQPFPSPWSVVIIDNHKWHRQVCVKLEQAVNARGGIVVWNPPSSPDLNPIEKFWDVWVSRLNATQLNCISQRIAMTMSHFDEALQRTRVTAKDYEFCGIVPPQLPH